MKPEQIAKAIELVASQRSVAADSLFSRLLGDYETATQANDIIWPEHQHAIIITLLQNVAAVLTDPSVSNINPTAAILYALHLLHDNASGRRTYADKTGVPSEAVASVAASLAPLPKT